LKKKKLEWEQRFKLSEKKGGNWKNRHWVKNGKLLGTGRLKKTDSKVKGGRSMGERYDLLGKKLRHQG